MAIEPAVPGRHELLGLLACFRLQVEHPPGATSTGTTLGVGRDGALLFQKGKCLLQHCFR